MKQSVLLIIACTCASILLLIISLIWDIPKLQVLSLGTFLSGLGASAGNETRRRQIDRGMKQKEVPLSFKVRIFVFAALGLSFLIVSFVCLSFAWKIIAVLANASIPLYIIYYLYRLRIK